MRGIVERPSGLELALDVLAPDDETAALTVMARLPLAPMIIQGTASRRLVAHFGVAYDPGSRSVTATGQPPPLLRSLADRAIRSLGRDPAPFTELLVTHYPPGAGIGSHRDAPAFGCVVGLSLMSPCTMRFSRGTGVERRVWEQVLPPRSAYLLDGPARTQWQHRIDAVRWERWSITARTMRQLPDRPGR